MKKSIFVFLFTILQVCTLFGASRNNLDRPLMFGPQYPFMYFTTCFVPDSGFTLAPGDFYFQTTYMENNAFSYTSDAKKHTNASAPPGEFTGRSTNGYSVYIDGELHRRIFRSQVGISESFEFQFVYRDVRIGSGHWDPTIESFHNNFNLGNQNREYAVQEELHIYVRNNETGENEYVITKKMNEFRKESATLALKMSIFSSEADALSLTIASNYGDSLFSELNEITQTEESTHKKFDDYVATFNYSSIFENWSFYAALSRAYIKNSIFENTRSYVDSAFMGINVHLFEELDVLLQTLHYSSIYPEGSTSNINNDIIEVSGGLRAFLTEETAIEIGFVENFTQGAQNTDIVFISSILMTF